MPQSSQSDWEAEAGRLQNAISKAASELDVAGRDPQAAYRASLWLRTGFVLDHPNYLTPEQVEGFLDV